MGRIDVCNIKYMNIYSGDLIGMKYDTPLKKYFDENSPFMNRKKSVNFQKIEKIEINNKENSDDLNENEKIMKKKKKIQRK